MNTRQRLRVGGEGLNYGTSTNVRRNTSEIRYTVMFTGKTEREPFRIESRKCAIKQPELVYADEQQVSHY